MNDISLITNDYVELRYLCTRGCIIAIEKSTMLWYLDEMLIMIDFWFENHPYVLKLVSNSLWECLVVENGIVRMVSFMLGLHLTKATWGSRLVGYLSKYHPYVLISNDMVKLLPKRFSWSFWCIVKGLLLLLLVHCWCSSMWSL